MKIQATCMPIGVLKIVSHFPEAVSGKCVFNHKISI